MDMQVMPSKLTLDAHVLTIYTSRDNDLAIGFEKVMIGTKQYKFPVSSKQLHTVGRYTRLTISRLKDILSVYTDMTGNIKSKVTTFKIPRGAKWILGQEQDTRGGGFDVNQRFIGNICNFRMWNKGIPDSSTKVRITTSDFRRLGTPAQFNSPPGYTFALSDGAKRIQVDDLKGPGKK